MFRGNTSNNLRSESGNIKVNSDGRLYNEASSTNEIGHAGMTGNIDISLSEIDQNLRNKGVLVERSGARGLLAS